MRVAGPVLEARNLVKHFQGRRGIFARETAAVRAVDDISFAIGPGKTLALVGESGCGKTTTAKLVLLLEQPTGGILRFQGQDLQALGGGSLREYRRSVQAVFQDPFASLNPRMRVGSIIAEPLVTNEPLPAAEVRTRILRLLELVGLPERAADLFPPEFSGGQRQQIPLAPPPAPRGGGGRRASGRGCAARPPRRRAAPPPRAPRGRWTGVPQTRLPFC